MILLLYNVLCILNKQQRILNNMFGLILVNLCLTVRVASFSIISLSYGKEDGILGGPLRAINLLSAEDNCLQLAESLMQNEAIFLEFSLKYDDGAPLELGPGAPLAPPSWYPWVYVGVDCYTYMHFYYQSIVPRIHNFIL